MYLDRYSHGGGIFMLVREDNLAKLLPVEEN